MTDLTDRTVTLRTPDLEDIDTIVESVRASLTELERWMPWAHAAYRADDAAQWLAKVTTDPDNHQFLVFADGKHLGNAGIWRTEDGNGEIGYWVRTDSAGRGIATSATRLLVGMGFERLGFDRIIIKADPAKIASHRVAEKAGGVRQSDHHIHTHEDGSVHELVAFIITR